MSFHLTPGTALEDVDGTTVIITENGDSAVLNGSASAIVNTVLSCSKVDEATKQLLNVYSVEQVVLTEDIKATVENLVEHGMLEEVNA